MRRDEYGEYPECSKSIAAKIAALEAENAALKARVAELEETLKGIGDADPTKWDPEVQDQFREWAQSRARFALRKESGT